MDNQNTPSWFDDLSAVVDLGLNVVREFRSPPVVPSGTTGGTIGVSKSGVAFSVSPTVLLAGAAVMIAVVYLVTRK